MTKPPTDMQTEMLEHHKRERERTNRLVRHSPLPRDLPEPEPDPVADAQIISDLRCEVRVLTAEVSALRDREHKAKYGDDDAQSYYTQILAGTLLIGVLLYAVLALLVYLQP